MKSEKKRALRYCDIAMSVVFIMMVLTRIFTLLYLSSIATETGAQIESVVEVYEANPLAKITLNLRGMAMIIQMGMLPALAVATYLFFRRRMILDRLDPEILTFYMNFSIFFFILNMTNDAALLAGRIF